MLASMSSERFFAELEPFDGFAGIVEPSSYHAVPDDWCVAITDVEDSTRAIAEGRFKDVNAIGAASIVAVLNAARDLPLPFVFGGDGATILFPASRRAAVAVALRGMRRLARESFGLALRVGIVPVADLTRAGLPVRVGRLRLSPWVSLAMLSGRGVTEAERRIKSGDHDHEYSVVAAGAEAQADLAGFECRWDPLHTRRGHIVTLLVAARGPDAETRSETYREVLASIDAVLGDVTRANPASLESLNIAGDARAFEQEARLLGGASALGRGLRGVQAWATAQLGRLLLRTGWRIPGFDGSAYRREVVQNTDFRKFDEMLRMVLDVTPAELAALEADLAARREGRRLAYGMHVSEAAVMTCLIFSHEHVHVHFVDGSGGGYATAAVALKQQLAEA